MEFSLLGNLDDMVRPMFEGKDLHPVATTTTTLRSTTRSSTYRPYSADFGRHIPSNEEVVVSTSKHRPKTKRIVSAGKAPRSAVNSTPSQPLPRPVRRTQKKVTPETPVDSSETRQQPLHVKHEERGKSRDGEGTKYCTGSICSPVDVSKLTAGGGVSPRGRKKIGKPENSKPPLGHLLFDGRFEGGNIADVKRLEDGSEYDIWLQHDTMNPRFRLWFDFRVSNNIPGQRAILTIINFSKTRTLYRHGMTPVFRILSSTDWHRIPVKDVFYYKSPKHNHNYILSMVITMENLGDMYEIAYTYPYTYTRVQYQLAWVDRWSYPFVRRETLCRTPQHRRVDVITIAQPMPRSPLPTSQVHTPSPFWLRSRRLSESCAKPDAIRVVFISARVHPGEAPASFVVEGLLDFLMSEDKHAVRLREEIVWVIVPMLNPDGCFMGHYRTDAGGVDLNRMWGQSSTSLEPSIHHTLQLLKRYYDDVDFSLDVYIDIHAHSNSKTSFLYCNPVPALFANSETLEQVAKLPRLVHSQMSNLCFSQQRWDADPVKAGCARRVAGAMFPQTMCYTLEISFFGCSDDGDGGHNEGDGHFASTIEGYREMGRKLALSFLDYYGTRNSKMERPFSSTGLRRQSRWSC